MFSSRESCTNLRTSPIPHFIFDILKFLVFYISRGFFCDFYHIAVSCIFHIIVIR